MKTIAIRVSDEDYAILKAEAAREGRSIGKHLLVLSGRMLLTDAARERLNNAESILPSQIDEILAQGIPPDSAKGKPDEDKGRAFRQKWGKSYRIAV